jgi:WD40 repeat protein
VISQEGKTDLAYAKLSPALDRLALSQGCDSIGSLVLRSSDNSFNSVLKLAPETTWLPAIGASDAEFSSDGTILIGICTGGFTCRVWNAANGEVLIDLDLKMTNETEIVGMPTNTHVLLCDSAWLTVCDIGSGNIIAALPIDEPLVRKSDPSSLHISPRGNFVVGATKNGSLRVFQTHNVVGVKMKTSLQRMKSK